MQFVLVSFINVISARMNDEKDWKYRIVYVLFLIYCLMLMIVACNTFLSSSFVWCFSSNEYIFFRLISEISIRMNVIHATTSHNNYHHEWTRINVFCALLRQKLMEALTPFRFVLAIKIIIQKIRLLFNSVFCILHQSYCHFATLHQYNTF